LTRVRNTPPELEVAYEEPEFKTDEEAAAWYMAHDIAKLDFVEEPLLPRTRLTTVAIRLPEAEIEDLKKRARRLGIGYTTYIRMLINRHLMEEKPIGQA
jgi:predicted DNA binding CopG/RHH family protein